MSPLEKLGLEVAAYQLLGSRMKGAMLSAFVLSSGRVLSVDYLTKVKPWLHQELTDPRNVIKSRVCLLRESLDDVGLGRVIETVPGGYMLPTERRQAVMDRLNEVAGQ